MAERQLITVNALREGFEAAKDKIEKALPAAFKDQADRFIQMSMVAFVTSKCRDKLEKCKPATYVRSLLEAASFGFALDGKNCYPIPYGDEVTCMFDYKAIVVCARRAGSIKDAWFQDVCENDHFVRNEINGKKSYEFRMAEDEDNRGDVKGAYAVVLLTDDTVRFEYMTRKELEKVRKSSKSPNSPAWQNWRERMDGKAVLKRALQGLDLDPAVRRMIDLDNREFDVDRIIDATPTDRKVAALDDLTDQLEAALGNVPATATPAIEQRSIEDEIPDFGVNGSAHYEVEPTKPVPVAETVPAQRAAPTPRPSARPSISSHPGSVRG
jgi:recombination protein RecT